ncbi:MAG: NAD(P)/FAD-dependent oxidoreductase [Nitrospirota bacterium]
MAYSSDVLIVGAGAGGLSLGLRLGSKGHRVRILQEQGPGLLAHRPELVQPAGLQDYAELGLLERLKARNVARVEQFHFHRIGGEPLCQVDYRALDHPYPYALVTLPRQTRRVLLEGLHTCPTVHVHWGTRLTGVLRRSGSAQVIGATATEGGRERDFYARVTIGADGSWSCLRDMLGLVCRTKRYRNAFLGLRAKRPKGLAGEWGGRVHYYLGHGEILGYFPVSPVACCLLFMVPAGDLAAIDGPRLAALKHRIRTIDPGLGDALGEAAPWEQFSRLFPVQIRTATWVADGAALLGDAAHACHPHVAQGSSQAMEDGRVLTDVLEGCFERGDFTARALAPYERIRRPMVERLQRVADEYAWLWETSNPVLTRLRDRIFLNIGKRPALLHRVAATEAGLEPRPLTFVERLRALGLCA